MRDLKIDICLTTIKSRLDTVGDVVLSLLDQKDIRATIHLFVSKEPYLLDEGVQSLPLSLQKIQRDAGERFRVLYCPNWGPYRKFAPYLQRHWGRNKLFTTADDDTIYPNTWLSKLYSLYTEKRSVVGYRGHRIQVTSSGFAPYRSWMRSSIAKNPSTSNIPTGKDGVLYNTSFFPVSILNMSAAMRLAPTADDLWLKWHLAYQGIPTFLANTDYRTSTFDVTETNSSLYKNFNKGGGNDSSVDKLNEYFLENLHFSLADKIRNELNTRSTTVLTS